MLADSTHSILHDIDDTLQFSNKALLLLDNMIMQIVEPVITSFANKQKTIKIKHLVPILHNILHNSPQYMHLISAAYKHVDWYMYSSNPKAPLSERAQIVLPIDNIIAHMHQHMQNSVMREDTSVFLGTILEMLLTIVIEDAVRRANERGRSVITEKTLMKCITHSPILVDTFKHCVSVTKLANYLETLTF